MKLAFISILLLIISIEANAQAFVRTEYIGSSNYKDENNEKTEGSGDAKIIQAGFKIPLSTKLNENNRPTAWAIGLGGSYASLGGKGLSKEYYTPEILNAQIGLMHMRPISEKWSMLASIGVGVFTDDTKISNIRFKHVMGHGGVIFIRHLKPTLDIGGGLALNNAFGYPMVFPAFYLNWRTEGRYQVRISLIDAIEISAGMELNRYLNLKVVGEMSGMMALVEKDGKDMVFTHQYVVAGIQPEFKISKSLSVPITAGVSAYRAAYFQERSLKAFFKEREHDPHFSVAPYVAVAIKYGF
ncbi:DUF6268 family outer membrane beta-barrel protein [Dysgonomonas sp. ZJ279]|uniref:DUF6268 family outer membrane beta-barrel protein n=1 Tax=Dysgonomonas sp. ZJ279 TaxID=2709796 RepID=UPI0013ECD59B|nr:DUF6268 family outer membrane beta-barrel protein [Dysgonomonas sp. ZJ279]